MRRPHAPRPRPVPSIPALTLTGALALTGALTLTGTWATLPTLAAPAAAKPRTTSARSVTPALVPFPRLEALVIHDVPLYPHVRGPFVVPGPAGLTAMADPIGVRVRAPGLPDNTQSLGRPPGGYPLDRLDYDPANGVIVTGLWHSGARNVPIAGEVLGVQEGGDDIEAAFVLLRPAHLDEASLRRYLQDPDCPEPRYAFEIRTASAALPLWLPASPSRAAPGTLDGRPVTAFSLAPARIETAAARLTFPPGTSGRKRASLSDGALLVARLLQGALPCELARGPRGPRTACTLRYLGVQFPPATPGAPAAPPVPPWPDPK